jgi:hypothetical protein
MKLRFWAELGLWLTATQVQPVATICNLLAAICNLGQQKQGQDRCLVSCDHLPRRSWPLFCAKANSRADLETTLLNYLKLYNHHIPQRALDAKRPILALKDWQKKQPELFVKRVYDQTGLDT